MIFEQKMVNGNWGLGGVTLIILLAILLLPTLLEAETYYVWGHVHTAIPLAAGEELPENPLSDVFENNPELIIGDNLVPQVTRNMVKVRIIKTSDGSEFGSYIVRHGGGYLIHNNTESGDVSVRFIVEELATSKKLLESDKETLSQGENTRFLLIPESVMSIDGGRTYAEALTPGNYTAIFTRVGKIELATEVGGNTYRLIDTVTGEATVPQVVVDSLHIPRYQDSPFGGNLFFFGAFSMELYDNSDIYYRIRIVSEDSTYNELMSAPLVKTKYTVNFTTGHVDAERITLGPLPLVEAGGYANCYRLTPIAEGSNIFWSFPDLVALWPTGEFNGKYTLSLEVIDLSVSDPENPPDFEPIANFTTLPLMLDNTPPTAKIEPLTSTAEDTPYVYKSGGSAGPVPPSDDLLNNLVGTFSDTSHYVVGANPACMILNLESPPAFTSYLAFKLTAHHPNGYLQKWYFWYKRNDKNTDGSPIAETLLGKIYNGTPTMDQYPGARVNSTQVSESGFENKYLYISADYLQPSSITDPLGSCGYRFVIWAMARATDGYHYLWHRWDDDIHYVQR